MRAGLITLLVVLCTAAFTNVDAQAGKGPDTIVRGEGRGVPNDDCTNAIPVSMQGLVSGTTVGATIDDTVAPFCGTSVTSPGVWYRFIAIETGNITVSMCQNGGSADYDAKLSVYSGSCAALVCEGGNDDTCGLSSEVTFAATSGTEYYMLVHGFGGATGNFNVDVSGAAIGAASFSVPANAPWALILLALAVGAVAIVVIRR